MTATQTQIRRATASGLASVTPALSELGHDTTNNRLVIGDGTTLGGILQSSAKDVQNNKFIYASAGGTANAITLTLTPAVSAYAAGQSFIFIATANNTTAATCNVSGLGAKNIYKMVDGSLVALDADDIVSGGVYRITYDGTQFQIENIATSASGGMTLLAIGSGGASEIAFTGITSDYRAYMFVLEGVYPSSSTRAIKIQTRDSGGSYNSNMQFTLITASNTSMSSAYQTNDITATLSGSSQPVSGHVLFSGLGQSYRSSITSQLATADRGWMALGVRDDSTAQDAVRFYFSSGNINGTIRMYGLQASL